MHCEGGKIAEQLITAELAGHPWNLETRSGAAGGAPASTFGCPWTAGPQQLLSRNPHSQPAGRSPQALLLSGVPAARGAIRGPDLAQGIELGNFRL